jgi:hypothetical protein
VLQLTLWLAICLTTCIVLNRRPVALLSIVLCSRVALPGVASSLISGSSSVHPTTFFIVVVLVWFLLTRPRTLLREFEASPALYFILTVVLMQAFVVTATVREYYDVQLLFNTFFAGSVFVFLVRSVVRSSPDGTRILMLTFIGAAVAQSVLAVAQFLTRSVIFYESARGSFDWFTLDSTRSVGTFDSPIDLAMFCAVAIPMAILLKNTFWKLSFAATMALGAILSQSRIGVLVAALGLLYLLARSKLSLGRRVLAIVATSLGASFLLLVPNELTSGISERVANDENSSALRGSALTTFFNLLPSQPWYGSGTGSSTDLRTSGLLDSSLENGILMHIYDNGLLFGALFVATMIAIPIIGAFRSALTGTSAAAVAAIVMAASFSGIYTGSAASLILFTALSFCAPRVVRRPNDPLIRDAPLKLTVSSGLRNSR